MVLPSSLCPMNAFGFRLPYVRSVKVSKRKETSPRVIKERGKIEEKKGSKKSCHDTMLIIGWNTACPRTFTGMVL